ncbi:MAG: LuxR family transcriptional regulator [Burkholderiales bacterium]|uniref:helix-turn-helix transcriptional regulator n=1 Tax=Roseateles sp. TaxID=1971397 RepID=UPI000FBEFEFE|nr:MAG: LuxR family transcriptional regulator [Burkholderiales bacterium]
MLDEQEFDAVVAGFYSAATGAIEWQQALQPLQRVFGCRFVALQSVDLQTERIISLEHGTPDAHAGVLNYVRDWHPLDPRRRYALGHVEQMSGRWWHCSEVFDDEFAAANTFHRHFLAANDSRYLSALTTQVTPTLLSWLALELPAARGPLNADERQLATRLGRHIAEALRAYERLRLLVSQALAGHTLLDGFSYPMWLLDEQRFIFHANGAALEAALTDGRIDTRQQRLQLCPGATDRQLAAQLLQLRRHRQQALIDLRPRPSDPPSWLHLQALAPERVFGLFGERPLLLATLFDARQSRALDPFALGDLFGMTPTQARVACLLAEGLSAPAIAAQLGCAQATVRTHLRQVLFKLGAKRLADAVRLLRQGEALWALPAAR